MVRDSDDDDAIPWETRQGLGRSLETQVEGLTGMISNDEQLNDQEEGLAEILNRSLADLLPDLRNMGRNLGRPAPAAPQPAPAPAPATPRHAPPRHSPPPPPDIPRSHATPRRVEINVRLPEGVSPETARLAMKAALSQMPATFGGAHHPRARKCSQAGALTRLSLTA